MQKSLAMEKLPKRSSESGQDYAAVESIEAVGSQLPLLGDRQYQSRNHFLLSPTETGIGPSSRGGLIATRGYTAVKVWMLCLPIKSTYASKATQTVKCR